MQTVLFNIGWMRNYRGNTAKDQVKGGGSYVEENDYGFEVFNFKPHRGYMYGYVPASSRSIDITRLGADRRPGSVAGITVVFTATRPSVGKVVIGWYKNAEVWDKLQPAPSDASHEYFARARKEDCKLLEIDERVLLVPHAKVPGDGFKVGQTPVRFINKGEERDPFIVELKRLLKNEGVRIEKGKKNTRSPRSDDSNLRMMVEKRAIENVKDYYRGKGYTCETREKDNVGWDLEFRRGKVLLRVEVKGCSGMEPTVELTPNEYQQMKRNLDSYRLAIVTRALEDKPTLQIVSYDEDRAHWRDQNSNAFRINELVGARITEK